MRKYELTYLVSDLVEEKDLNKVTGKVSALISELDGKLTKEEIWGRRKLAYPIQKQTFATYITLYFELPAPKVAEFEKDLFHMNDVLRHLLIVKDFGEEVLTLTKEEIAKTDEIEKVVGGEKSFEAIEGETEESKDLMAKRETAEEIEVVEEESSKEDAKKPEESKEEVVEEKPTKKPRAKKSEEPKEEVKEAAKEEKPKAKKAKKDDADEADRLDKLNKEIEDILSDEI